MALIARIIGLSLLTGLLGAWLGFALFRQDYGYGIISLCLACVAGIVGGVAGATREIATALRERSGT